MTDDIVIRLRQFVRRCNHGWDLGNDWYPAPTECVSCTRQREAADEIERLRAAGDQLALRLIDNLFDHDQHSSGRTRDIIESWRVARNGS